MTDQITPQEAQQLLDGATPEPWEHYDDDDVMISLRSERGAIACDLNKWDADLITAAPRLAATIAADTLQYGVEHDPIASSPDWQESPVLCYLTVDTGLWAPEIEVAKEALEDYQRRFPDVTYRLVARRVSPTWEVKE